MPNADRKQAASSRDELHIVGCYIDRNDVDLSALQIDTADCFAKLVGRVDEA